MWIQCGDMAKAGPWYISSGFAFSTYSLYFGYGILPLSANQSRPGRTYNRGVCSRRDLTVTQLIHSLFERRPFPPSLSIHALPTHQDRLHFLLELAFKVPEIIETVDSIIAGNFQAFRCVQDDLVRRLSTFEIALRSWLATYSPSNGVPSTVRSGLIVDNTRGSTSSPGLRNSLFNLTCETLCRICHLLVVDSQARLDDQASSIVSSSSSPTSCANDLRQTMLMLEDAAGTPICKSRVMSVPLHFLSEYCKRHGDDDGLSWCRKTKERLQSQAPYLHWDALLPWCLLTLNEIPHYDADPYA